MDRVLAIGVIVAALVFAGTQAMGREHLRCESEVADRLAELNVAETDIAGISTIPKYVARAQFGLPRVSKDFNGVTAWGNLDSCKGSVVIDLNRRCRINQSWTKGRVPGRRAQELLSGDQRP